MVMKDELEIFKSVFPKRTSHILLTLLKDTKVEYFNEAIKDEVYNFLAKINLQGDSWINEEVSQLGHILVGSETEEKIAELFTKSDFCSIPYETLMKHKSYLFKKIETLKLISKISALISEFKDYEGETKFTDDLIQNENNDRGLPNFMERKFAVFYSLTHELTSLEIEEAREEFLQDQLSNSDDLSNLVLSRNSSANLYNLPSFYDTDEDLVEEKISSEIMNEKAEIQTLTIVKENSHENEKSNDSEDLDDLEDFPCLKLK